VRDGSIYLGKWAPNVPEEVKSKVEQLEKQFMTGALEVQIEDKKIIE
jgi:hypothetical protein